MATGRGCSPKEPVLPSFLTVAEIAELLKLNQQMRRNWIDAGDRGAVRVGHPVRVRQSELDRFIAAAKWRPYRRAGLWLHRPERGSSQHLSDPIAEANAALDPDDDRLPSSLESLTKAAGDLTKALEQSSSS